MKNRKTKVRIFSALEVANICGVVNQTAINWIKNGYLKAFTTPGGQYRIYKDDLIAFLQGREMRVPEDLTQEKLLKVLVVDDDEELNQLVSQYLAKHIESISVQQAYDGYDAGRLLTEHKPHVVILDIDLPGIDGYEICRKIKEDFRKDSPLVIAISGMSSEDVEGRIREKGADAFYSKPLDFDEILKAVQKR